MLKEARKFTPEALNLLQPQPLIESILRLSVRGQYKFTTSHILIRPLVMTIFLARLKKALKMQDTLSNTVTTSVAVRINTTLEYLFGATRDIGRWSSDSSKCPNKQAKILAPHVQANLDPHQKISQEQMSVVQCPTQGIALRRLEVGRLAAPMGCVGERLQHWAQQLAGSLVAAQPASFYELCPLGKYTINLSLQ